MPSAAAFASSERPRLKSCICFIAESDNLNYLFGLCSIAAFSDCVEKFMEATAAFIRSMSPFSMAFTSVLLLVKIEIAAISAASLFNFSTPCDGLHNNFVAADFDLHTEYLGFCA